MLACSPVACTLCISAALHQVSLQHQQAHASCTETLQEAASKGGNLLHHTLQLSDSVPCSCQGDRHVFFTDAAASVAGLK